LVPDAARIVHDVAQPEHELRRGTPRLKGEQAGPELSLVAHGLVIDQDEVRSDPEGDPT
jgi:hypothetical protein